jgi:hypothetical protein
MSPAWRRTAESWFGLPWIRQAGDQPRQRRQLFVAVVTVLGARSKGCERGDQERDALAREVVDRLKRVLIPGIRVLIPCRVENVQVQALVTILIAFHNFGDTTILLISFRVLKIIVECGDPVIKCSSCCFWKVIDA